MVDGEIIAAQEEDLLVKHDASYPSNAINYCLLETNLSLSQVDYFVFTTSRFKV